ncbi:hypothetical protein Micbo1qcDRAFT_158406 [Microdochium bolleyi]|uniref:Calcineurin-like phosphoesterase domain-containing protein n=1 Tax=Microdochium bolleyi TaxID=196109 RepID=A0A136JGA4_9PEZI|nr:hypothetical protein Micbo1qcDRAFT_158406 [Microdochium bolleyi]
MTPAAALRNVARILAPLAVVLTTYLYLYPVFMGCAFPLPPQLGDDSSNRPQPSNSVSSPAFHATVQQHLNASNADRAPFRLLTLGDPQLEGDTSIPNYGHDPFWHLTWAIKHLVFKTHQPSLRLRIKQILHDLIDFWLDDIPNAIEAVRKTIDLFGNDFYLAHIYRTLHWWTKPSHVTVLGDLLGSQWITDEEFERRSWRYWNRSFRGAERVPDEIAQEPADEYDVAGLLGVEDDNAAAWRRRIINIAGNHDVGYAGDLVQSRLDRFERAFGKVSYELRFELPVTNATSNATIYDPETNRDSNRLIPELRLVIINNMNLDMPAVNQSLQDSSYGFLNKAISTSTAVEYKGHFTIVMTHIPLYKPEGICVDAPFFDFFDEGQGGGIKEQNQLSADASKGFLEGIYGLNGDPNAAAGGMGRPGVILNGHDHEGCDTYHYINQTLAEGEEPPAKWRVARWPDAAKPGAARIAGVYGVPGIREVTVRSMMGEFGGNAGLLSAWFDEDTWEWRYEFVTCALGRQYLWWFVHIIDFILVVVVLLYAGLAAALGAGLVTDRWPAVLVRYVDEWKQKAQQALSQIKQRQAAAQAVIKKAQEGNGSESKKQLEQEKTQTDSGLAQGDVKPRAVVNGGEETPGATRSDP